MASIIDINESSLPMGQDVGEGEINIGGSGSGTPPSGGNTPNPNPNPNPTPPPPNPTPTPTPPPPTPTPTPTPTPPPPTPTPTPTPPPPSPITDFELKSLTFLANEINTVNGVYDPYKFLWLYNTPNNETVFNTLDNISERTFIDINTQICTATIQRITTEFGYVDEDLIEKLKEIDEKLLEYLILHLKNEGRYYHEDGFEKYLYDNYVDDLKLIAKDNNKSNEYLINGNATLSICSANSSGQDFILMCLDTKYDVLSSCILSIDEEYKIIKFQSKLNVEYPSIAIDEALSRLKNQKYVWGRLEFILDSGYSNIYKQFLGFVNLIN